MTRVPGLAPLGETAATRSGLEIDNKARRWYCCCCCCWSWGDDCLLFLARDVLMVVFIVFHWCSVLF